MSFLVEMFLLMFGFLHDIITSNFGDTKLVNRQNQVYYFADLLQSIVSVKRNQGLNIYYKSADGFKKITVITFLVVWLKYLVTTLKENFSLFTLQIVKGAIIKFSWSFFHYHRKIVKQNICFKKWKEQLWKY